MKRKKSLSKIGSLKVSARNSTKPASPDHNDAMSLDSRQNLPSIMDKWNDSYLTGHDLPSTEASHAQVDAIFKH